VKGSEGRLRRAKIRVPLRRRYLQVEVEIDMGSGSVGGATCLRLRTPQVEAISVHRVGLRAAALVEDADGGSDRGRASAAGAGGASGEETGRDRLGPAARRRYGRRRMDPMRVRSRWGKRCPVRAACKYREKRVGPTRTIPNKYLLGGLVF
jgi:hypothetical protein